MHGRPRIKSKDQDPARVKAAQQKVPDEKMYVWFDVWNAETDGRMNNEYEKDDV